jgi:hypothetical protein
VATTVPGLFAKIDYLREIAEQKYGKYERDEGD